MAPIFPVPRRAADDPLTPNDKPDLDGRKRVKPQAPLLIVLGLLFGGFGLYALYAMWSRNRRGVRPGQARRAIAGDIGAVVAGLIAYAFLLRFHASLFGVAA